MAIDYRFTSDDLLEQQDPDGSYSVHTLGPDEKALFDARVWQWHPIVLANSERTGVPVAVIDAIMFGEGADPNAHSFDGGLGLMQITSNNIKQGLSDNEVMIPENNIKLGTDYLQTLAMKIGSYDPVRLASGFNCGSPRPSQNAPWGLCEYTIPDTGAQPYISKVVRAYNYVLLNPPAVSVFGGSGWGRAAKVAAALAVLGLAAYAGVAIAKPEILPAPLRKVLPARLRGARGEAA